MVYEFSDEDCFVLALTLGYACPQAGDERMVPFLYAPRDIRMERVAYRTPLALEMLDLTADGYESDRRYRRRD